MNIDKVTAAELTASYERTMRKFRSHFQEVETFVRYFDESTKKIMDAYEAGHTTREQSLLEAYLVPHTFPEIKSKWFKKISVDLGILKHRMVDLRNQLGEQNFESALRVACPTIPWKFVESLTKTQTQK